MPDTLLRTDRDITEIYNRHVNTVYKVCFMYLKNVSDTEDAVQSTFIKLMECKKTFVDHEHEKAWLIVTATNTCKNLLRHWWRKTVDITTLSENEGENHDLDDTLAQVLALPPKYKTAVYLYYYEGYSTVEIAKMLNKKESTVRSFLHVGRKLLKICLGGEAYES